MNSAEKSPSEKSKQQEKPSFEISLEQLQNIVKRLESGEMSLEDALKGFEEGIRLSRLCQEHLVEAERRVEILTRAGLDGQVETQAFHS